MLKVEVMTHGYKQKLGSRPPPIEWLFTDSADWVPGLRKRVHAFHFSAASSTSSAPPGFTKDYMVIRIIVLLGS